MGKNDTPAVFMVRDVKLFRLERRFEGIENRIRQLREEHSRYGHTPGPLHKRDKRSRELYLHLMCELHLIAKMTETVFDRIFTLRCVLGTATGTMQGKESLLLKTAKEVCGFPVAEAIPVLRVHLEMQIRELDKVVSRAERLLVHAVYKTSNS